MSEQWVTGGTFEEPEASVPAGNLEGGSPPEGTSGAPGGGGPAGAEGVRPVPAEAGDLADAVGPTPFHDLGNPPAVPRLAGRGKGRRLVRKTEEPERQSFGPEQRLLLLDTWRRSGLPTGEFADLIGISKHTLYGWHRRGVARPRHRWRATAASHPWV